jgi:putative flippase GtrA
MKVQGFVQSSSTHIQFIKYFVAAGLGLAVDFSTLIFTKQILQFNYLIAACCGFILGLIVTYFLSNKFVFGTPKQNPQKLFILFGVIGLVGLGTLDLIMWVLTSKLGINYIIAKTLATIVVFIWNFFARKTLYGDDVKNLPYEL